MANSILYSVSQLQTLLQQPPVSGKRELEPLKSFSKESGFPMKVLEDHEVENAAELHTYEDDLWLCLEGEAVFLCGGTLINGEAKIGKDGVVNEKEWKGTGIEGATEHTLHSGDWLWIPAGEAHQHRAQGTARLAIIKIPSKKNS